MSKGTNDVITPGVWFVAERGRWNGDVRFIRTSADDSGVVGVTADRDAAAVAMAPMVLDALVRLRSALVAEMGVRGFVAKFPWIDDVLLAACDSVSEVRRAEL